MDGTDTVSPMTTIGVVGRPIRAEVAPWGGVAVDADPRRLEWYVAADDRWHDPQTDPTVRQARIEGTPVIETRIKVPDGDAVQRVWSVPDHGGVTVVEVENQSPLPFAVAVTGVPVATSRPPADVDIVGIDLPDDAVCCRSGIVPPCASGSSTT